MKFKIKGKEYQAFKGWAAVKNFAIRHEPKFETFIDVITHFKDMDYERPTIAMINDFGLLMFCFLERGSHKDDEILDLSIDDIIDWLGETKNFNNALKLLHDSFGETEIKESELAEVSDEDPKKNG